MLVSLVHVIDITAYMFLPAVMMVLVLCGTFALVVMLPSSWHVS